MSEVSPPQQSVARTGTRAIVEAAMQAHPVPAFFARLYQFTHPPAFEAELEQWRVKISTRVNEHSVILDELTHRLTRRLVISDLAVTIAMKLVERDEAGFSATPAYEDIRQLLPEQDEGKIQEALHELEDLGLVTTYSMYEKPISHVELHSDIYTAFDPVIFGWDTMSDARKLAEMLLEDEDRGNIRKLFADVEWPRRRFNPAVCCLLPLFDVGRISEECQVDFPTYHVWISAQERFRLRRFVAGG